MYPVWCVSDLFGLDPLLLVDKISEICIGARVLARYEEHAMARRLKRHLQQALFDERGRAGVLDGKVVPHRQPSTRTRRLADGTVVRVRIRKDGKLARKPGRKPKNGKRAGAPHKARPELDPNHPVHVVLRVVDAIRSLRKRHMYKALREATIAVALRELHDHPANAFRIVHISIQRNHVHLLVEAQHKLALSRGMQSFQISAAKHLNRAVSLKSMRTELGTKWRRNARYRAAMRDRRRGTVFPDRFHQEIITTPKQARHALAYVLNNWRKHREDRDGIAATWKVDPFSTGVQFDGWKERADALTYMNYRDTYQPMFVYLPKTWLLYEGWRKHGLISFDEVPSTKQIEKRSQQAARMYV
jgi:REP element-mobilizing transposase RayT